MKKQGGITYCSCNRAAISLLLVLVVLLAGCQSARYSTDNHKSWHQLVGNVKTVTQTTYQLTRSGDTLTRGSIQKQGDVFGGDHQKIYYGPTGNIDSIQFLDISYSTSYTVVFQYSDGIRTGYLTFDAFKNQVAASYRKVDKLKRTATIITEEFDTLRNIHIYDLDAKGEVIGYHLLNGEEDLVGRVIYTARNRNGWLMEREFHPADSLDYTIYITKYERNRKGIVTKTVKTEMVDWSKILGEPVENSIVLNQSAEGDFNTTTSTYEHEYDRRGNWISQKEFTNGQPKTVTLRVITYY